jgi:Carboxypeptidase regulatory-like domain
MKFFVALLGVLVLSGTVALAEGTVTVHVVDTSTGKPVEGQGVRLTDAAGDFVATTDKRGNALFLTVPVGRSSVDATAGAYKSRCQPYFTVASNQHRIVTIDVERASKDSAAGPLCALPGLVNPGEGSDVYDIF